VRLPNSDVAVDEAFGRCARSDLQLNAKPLVGRRYLTADLTPGQLSPRIERIMPIGCAVSVFENRRIVLKWPSAAIDCHGRCPRGSRWLHKLGDSGHGRAVQRLLNKPRPDVRGREGCVFEGVGHAGDGVWKHGERAGGRGWIQARRRSAGVWRGLRAMARGRRTKWPSRETGAVARETSNGGAESWRRSFGAAERWPAWAVGHCR
jgi:hypothetical protein